MPKMIAALILVFGLIVTTEAARAEKDKGVCGFPTSRQGSHCVLEQDVVLTETLVLASHTRLNCKGHSISPVATGKGSTATTHVASTPEVAIVLQSAEDVEIENCRIGGGFDFGITIFASTGAKIKGNEIHTRMQGITLIESDDNRISENEIRWSSGGGVGISILRNSDRNRISGNTLVSPVRPLEFAPETPGTRAPATCADCGVRVVNPLSPVINLVVGGKLSQVPDSPESTNDDNVIEENVVNMARRGISTGIRSRSSVIRGNRVSGGGSGIAATDDNKDQDFRLPGRCSLDRSRYCATSEDCNIPGVDGSGRGTCSGVQNAVADLVSVDVAIENNTLLGPFDVNAIILGATRNAVARGNVVTGGATMGIQLAEYALETATVTGNRIEGAATGIHLGPVCAARFFGARVSLNDIVGSTLRAITAAQEYAFPSELSVDGRGNYWGHTCSEGGFVPGDSSTTLIFDSHPYGTPVAGTSGRKPPPCS